MIYILGCLTSLNNPWCILGCNYHNRGASATWYFPKTFAGTYSAHVFCRGSQRYAYVTDMKNNYLSFNAADDASLNNDGYYYILCCGYTA